MSAFTVNLGIKDLQRKLADINKYDAATQDRIRSAVRTSTENIYIGVKRRIPVRKGDLTKKTTRSYNAAKNEGKVVVKSSIAHLVEFGAKGAVERPDKKRALHGGKLTGFAAKVNIPARKEHPSMRPAFEDEKPNLIKNVEDAIKP